MNSQSYAERARQHQRPTTSIPSTVREKGEKREKVQPPESLIAIAHRERWDMDATVAYIVALSDKQRTVYRAALAFDTAALKRADAVLAEGKPTVSPESGMFRCGSCRLIGPVNDRPCPACKAMDWKEMR